MLGLRRAAALDAAARSYPVERLRCVAGPYAGYTGARAADRRARGTAPTGRVGYNRGEGRKADSAGAIAAA
jgi:hypothetical protein